MKNTFVIFGATGDLTHRKLFPAFYNLQYEGMLPDDFAVVAVGRRRYVNDEYRTLIKRSVLAHSRLPLNADIWARLAEKISYYHFDFLRDNYDILESYLRGIDESRRTGGNRIYYLAVAPEYFSAIVGNIKQSKTALCMIEKPFGSGLESARALNKIITDAFPEDNIYRIDHYLGKEMLQSIMSIRFANTIFEPLLNKHYVEQIQILSAETLGIETRGRYYDKTGEIRDMLQSHILQLISLIAMDRPVSSGVNDIRDEKVKVLKALKKYDVHTANSDVVLGQYGAAHGINAYRDEENIGLNSNTETFVALKLFIENSRWSGVPFYIRSGKRLPAKATEIIIEFKKSAYGRGDVLPNILVFKIQPEESVFLRFNTKEIGAASQGIIPVNMDFCQNCHVAFNSPEAYEKLLFDAMRKDATLFTRWDEVEASWEFIESISNHKNTNRRYPNYLPFTWGPAEADALIKKDGRAWYVLRGEHYENL